MVASLATLIVVTLWILAPRWGPGTHILFARRLLDEDRDEIPAEARQRITAHESHFLYGNIAADIINFKNYGDLKDHCHNWNMRERLQEIADTEAEQAFILGYLCHLAADVVAHNHFVPYQLVHGLPPRLLGHIYWEARADGRVPEAHWETIDSLRLDRSLHENDRLIVEAVPKRAFSLKTNKLIFNNVLLARSRRSWRAIMDQMVTRTPRGTLHRDYLTLCYETCRAHMLATFHEDSLAGLRTFDPNGHAALSESLRLRRELIGAHGSRAAAADASRDEAERRYGLPGRNGPQVPRS